MDLKASNMTPAQAAHAFRHAVFFGFLWFLVGGTLSLLLKDSFLIALSVVMSVCWFAGAYKLSRDFHRAQPARASAPGASR